MDVFHVDPDADARDRVTDRLAGEGFEVHAFGTLSAARAALDGTASVAREGIDCVVAEHELPDGTGLELFRAVRETVPDAACVLYTNDDPAGIDTDAYGEVVAEYLRKGDDDSLDSLVELLERSAALRVQTAYPLPDDESARLAALDRYAVDPGELDEALDRLTELATELFGVNSAAVGLVDEHHEEFLSCHGASFGRLDRESTVCTYAILEDGAMVVENLQADPRFSDNAGLAAAGIRFYAGVPLVTPDGHAIGTFCIHDDEPRSFDGRDRRLLGLLADETMDHLELRRRLREQGAGE